MTPFDPGYLGMGNPLYVQTGQPQQPMPSNLSAILALLSGVQHGAASVAPPPPRHFGPPEGPLGANAHLGWGQKPRTLAGPRKAAPTPRTKMGGYLGGAPAPSRMAVASVIRSLLSGSTPHLPSF